LPTNPLEEFLLDVVSRFTWLEDITLKETEHFRSLYEQHGVSLPPAEELHPLLIERWKSFQEEMHAHFKEGGYL
jgi:hypothetical protein